MPVRQLLPRDLQSSPLGHLLPGGASGQVVRSLFLSLRHVMHRSLSPRTRAVNHKTNKQPGRSELSSPNSHKPRDSRLLGPVDLATRLHGVLPGISRHARTSAHDVHPVCGRDAPSAPGTESLLSANAGSPEKSHNHTTSQSGLRTSYLSTTRTHSPSFSHCSPRY